MTERTTVKVRIPATGLSEDVPFLVARMDFSRPGKPTDNAYIETFNGVLRDECLNLSWFDSITEARRRDYHESRPHSALDHMPPGQRFTER